MKSVSNTSKAALFTAIVMIVATIMGLVFKLPGILYMFAPAIAVVILLLVTGGLLKRKSWTELGLGKAGFEYWGYALLVPVIVLTTSYVILWSTPLASFQIPEGVTTSMWLMFPVKLLLGLAAYTVTSSLAEEIGWRGYLLPKLQQYGSIRALVLVGIIHGVFHFPIMFAGNYHAEGNLLVIIPMFLLSTILASIMFGVTRIRTGSVWPAAIMHAVHNIAWGELSAFTVSHSDQSAYIGGESGVIVLTLYSLVALWMVRKERTSLSTR
ncbi:CPBP family intramembrane metalloprotease [Paenibacillus sp. TRM 82003]|nr:CPBP family intramembrane metalloprotease [Paenibacillus sp. TRM 82003]